MKCTWKIPNEEDTLSLKENPFDFRETMLPGVL